jgi:hypothetical protein
MTVSSVATQMMILAFTVLTVVAADARSATPAVVDGEDFMSLCGEGIPISSCDVEEHSDDDIDGYCDALCSGWDHWICMGTTLWCLSEPE